ncbi:MAG: hypothetical protein ACLSEX_03990 [Blautia sp.]
MGTDQDKGGTCDRVDLCGSRHFCPALAPNDPLLVDVARKLEAPSSTYWLGTDQLGRCIASRLIWEAVTLFFIVGWFWD